MVMFSARAPAPVHRDTRACNAAPPDHLKPYYGKPSLFHMAERELGEDMRFANDICGHEKAYYIACI